MATPKDLLSPGAANTYSVMKGNNSYAIDTNVNGVMYAFNISTMNGVFCHMKSHFHRNFLLNVRFVLLSIHLLMHGIVQIILVFVFQQSCIGIFCVSFFFSISISPLCPKTAVLAAFGLYIHRIDEKKN